MRLDNKTGAITVGSFSETRAPFSRAMIQHDFSMVNEMMESQTPVQSDSIFQPLVYHACEQVACNSFNYISSFDCDLNYPDSWKNDMDSYYDHAEECFLVGESIFNQSKVAFPIIPGFKMYMEFSLKLVKGKRAVVHFGGVYLDLAYALIDDPELYCPVGSYDWTGSNGEVVGATGEWKTFKNLLIGGAPKTGVGNAESNWKSDTMKYFQPLLMLNEGEKGATVAIRSMRVWYESETPPDASYTSEYGFYIGPVSTNLVDPTKVWVKPTSIDGTNYKVDYESSLDHNETYANSIHTYKKTDTAVATKDCIKIATCNRVTPTQVFTVGVTSWISDDSKFSLDNFSIVFKKADGTVISTATMADKVILDEDVILSKTMAAPAETATIEVWFRVLEQNMGCRFLVSKPFICLKSGLSFSPPSKTAGGQVLRYQNLNLTNSFTHFYKLVCIRQYDGVLFRLQDTLGKFLTVSVVGGKISITADGASLMNTPAALLVMTNSTALKAGDIITILLRKQLTGSLFQIKVGNSAVFEATSTCLVSLHYFSEISIGSATTESCAIMKRATMMKQVNLEKPFLDSMHRVLGHLAESLTHNGFDEMTEFQGMTAVDMSSFYNNEYGLGYITRSMNNNIMRSSCPTIRNSDQWKDIRPFTRNDATPYGLGYTYLSGSLNKVFNEFAYGPTYIEYTPRPWEEGMKLLLSGWIHVSSDCDLQEVGYFVEGQEKTMESRVYDMSRKGEFQLCWMTVLLGDKTVKIMTSPKNRNKLPTFEGECTFSGMNVIVSPDERILPGAAPTNASTIEKFYLKLNKEYGLLFNKDWTLYYRKVPICGCNNTDTGAALDCLGKPENLLVWGKDEEFDYIVGSGPIKPDEFWMNQRDVLVTYNSAEKKMYFYEHSAGQFWSRVIVKDITTPDEYVRADGTDFILGGTIDETHGAMIGSVMMSLSFTSLDNFKQMARERGSLSGERLLSNEFIEV